MTETAVKESQIVTDPAHITHQKYPNKQIYNKNPLRNSNIAMIYCSKRTYKECFEIRRKFL
jgi:hypothetical protein